MSPTGLLLVERVRGRSKPYETNCGLWIWAIQIKFDWLIDWLIDLTVSSSSSLISPLRLLWMKALALLDLAILILASLAFWAWEEEEVRVSDWVGRRWEKMTNTLFHGENLPTHPPNWVVVVTATTVPLLPPQIVLYWVRLELQRAFSVWYCVLLFGLVCCVHLWRGILRLVPFWAFFHFLCFSFEFLACIECLGTEGVDWPEILPNNIQ